MNRDAYRKIAKKHGISVEEVKKEMEIAIADAYKNPNAEALAVPREGDIPTPEEFIAHIANVYNSEISSTSTEHKQN